VLTHASIVCGSMLVSVNSVNKPTLGKTFSTEPELAGSYYTVESGCRLQLLCLHSD